MRSHSSAQVFGPPGVGAPVAPLFGVAGRSLSGDAQSERESVGRLIWGRRAGRLPVLLDSGADRTLVLSHHAGADGVVRRFVDQDEGAGRAADGVRVGRELAAEAQPDAADRVELELVRRLAIERGDVEAVLDRV